MNIEFSYVLASNFKMTIQNIHLFPCTVSTEKKEHLLTISL